MLSRLLIEVLRLTVFGLALNFLSLAAGADTPPRLVVIFDGSGSMWGSIGQNPKVATAQQALERKLGAIDGRLEVGFVSFGNRRKANCEDIETIVPVGPLDAASLTIAIDNLSPRGKSPLAGALEAAAAALGDGPGHILVIGDGGDNCKRDPCAVAESYAAGDPTRTVDVISLVTDEKEKPKLACVASKGRGQLIEVIDPGSFDKALDTLFARLPGIAEPPPADPQVAIVEPASLSAIVRLAAASQPIVDGVKWLVRKGGLDGEIVYTAAVAPAKLSLRPGLYTVEASIGRISGNASVKVAAAGPATAAIDLGAARLQLKTVRGGAASTGLEGGAFYSIFQNNASSSGEATIAIAHDENPSFLLPSGDYRLVLEDGLTRIERTIKLNPGDEKTEAINLDVGTLVLEARASAEAVSPLTDVVFSVREDDPAAPGGERELVRSAREAPRLVLPAGVFHVVARSGLAEARVDATVKSGDVNRQTVIIPSASLRARARLSGSAEALTDQLEFRVVRDADAVEVYRGSRALAEVVLPPGPYRIVAALGEINAVAENSVVLAAGETKDLMIDVPAGMVTLSLKGLPGNAAPTLWEIHGADGALLWTTSETEPRLPLLSGTYDAIAVVRNKTLQARFTLEAGEKKTVTLSPQ